MNILFNKQNNIYKNVDIKLNKQWHQLVKNDETKEIKNDRKMSLNSTKNMYNTLVSLE